MLVSQLKALHALQILKAEVKKCAQGNEYNYITC